MNYDFNSIAGYKTEKKELEKLCDIFNNKDKYLEKGAKLPKGVIFYGPAGNGKTLFAKVMASVCRTQMLTIDLSNAEDMNGIGRNIKTAFSQAAEQSDTVIIFFDELDKVLPNYSEDYHTDNSKTILTQLLTLIDGMNSSNNIVFVATCNDYDQLPESLVRPGRIDKKIFIGNPSYASRIDILKMYASKTKCIFDTPFETVAKLCAGLCCAALESLINECVLNSESDGKIDTTLIYDKIAEIRKQDIIKENSRKVNIAMICRNVGAFVVARTFNDGEYVLNDDYSSVCNNYFNSLIFDYNDDFCDDDYEDDDYEDEFDDEDCENYNDDMDEDNNDDVDDEHCEYYSKSELLDAISVLYGGLAAEQVILGDAYDNMRSYTESIEMIALALFKNGMLGSELEYDPCRNTQLAYSQEIINKINKQINTIKSQCYLRAHEIIIKNRTLITNLMDYLKLNAFVNKEDCEALLAEFGGIKE